MRNKIRKLIIEVIGDIEEEYKYFGSDLVTGLRNDPIFKNPINKGIESDKFKEYVANKYNLLYLGMGHFRIVFEIPGSGMIIKFATKGVSSFLADEGISSQDANLQEVKRFNKYPEFFPKLYAHDENGIWVIIEKANSVITSKIDFSNAILNTFPSFRYISPNTKVLITYHLNIKKNLDKDIWGDFDYNMFLSLIETAFDGTHEKISFLKPYLKNNSLISNEPELIPPKIFKKILLSNEMNDETLKKIIAPEIRTIIRNTFTCLHDLLHYDKNKASENYYKIGEDVIRRLHFYEEDFVEMHTMNILSDRHFIGFLNMLKTEKVGEFDIQPHNVGTNEEGKLIVLDATSFLGI